jgi:DNA-binding transcriptional MerR regulator/methylmalonyl-CoA mutase cobalamin-binding subunit
MNYEAPRNTIGVVARRTGLTQHVIRVWERRYSAIVPSRTATQRRLYSDADIDRLILLSRLTGVGHAIGQVARRSNEELLELLGKAAPQAAPLAAIPLTGDAGEPEGYVLTCRRAVSEMDSAMLESALMEACRALGQPVFIESVLLPLLQWAGEAWQDGSIRIAHEHVLSACVAYQLGEIRNSRPASPGAPVLLCATPAGQLHELGAAIVATLGALDGWRVVYLGPNLPADEIANAAVRVQARAVALSIVFPPDDPHLDRELATLRRFMPPAVPLLAGGQACAAYQASLAAAGAHVFQDTHSFRETLARLRQGLPPLVAVPA